MKLNILSTKNATKGTKELPKQFNEPIRLDLIKRAVLAKQSHDRQPYGAYPLAGKRSSSYVSKRRHAYKSTYGIGQSRTPRKVMSFRGQRFNWVGAFAPQTVGGRRAHPPKASKSWIQKINKKERLKAIRSALAATMQKDLVEKRGHKVPDNYPFIIDNDFEALTKTKDVRNALEAIGMGDDLNRTQGRKVRAGKGKMRGRYYKTKTGPLFVVAGDCALLNATKNLRGVDVVRVNEVNAELLAPGTDAGRMTLFTAGAVDLMAKDELFLTVKAPTQKQKAPTTKKSSVTKSTKKVAEVKA